MKKQSCNSSDTNFRCYNPPKGRTHTCRRSIWVRKCVCVCGDVCVPQQQLLTPHGSCRRRAEHGIHTHFPHEAQLGRALQHYKNKSTLSGQQLHSFLFFCPLFSLFLFFQQSPPSPALFLSVSAVVPFSLTQKQAPPPLHFLPPSLFLSSPLSGRAAEQWRPRWLASLK